MYAQKYYKAVKRAGHKGNRLTLGANLFKTILSSRSGAVTSKHTYDEVWELIAHEDGRIHLAIPEMRAELAALKPHPDSDNYPFILMAGERRSYNANQIYRDPSWRKIDPHGYMRMHPEDADTLTLTTGDRVRCSSAHGSIEAVIEIDDSVRTGIVTLPHGYGMRYGNSAPVGPELNRLTHGDHCEPLTKTPYHKHLHVKLEKVIDRPVEAEE